MPIPDIAPRVTYGSLDLTAAPYALIFGSDFGGPELVVQTLVTFLQDGEYEISDRSSNRTLTLPVLTEAANLNLLADAEQALVLEARKPLNTLTIDPGDGSTLPTVFDTFVGDVQFARNDEYEKQGLRVWNLTISALPYGRDQRLTTVQATTAAAANPPAAQTIVIDDGSSAAKWSSNSSNVSSDGSRVRFSAVSMQSARGIDGTYTGLIDLTSTRLVYIDFLASQPTSSVSASIFPAGSQAGLSLSPYSVAYQSSGYYRVFFKVPADYGNSFSAFNFRADFGSFSGPLNMDVDQLARTNQDPIAASTRQRLRTIQVGGSARARASLSISAPSGDVLGDLTILYTRSGMGFQPPLRQYRASSATVNTDSSTMSGGYNSLGNSPNTAMTFYIPAKLFREAAYNLAAYLRATSTGTYSVTWSARLTQSNGGLLGPESQVVQSGTASFNFPTANAWQYSDLGAPQLPTVPVSSGSDRVIALTLQASSAAVEIDEAWLFDLDNGALSVVNTFNLATLEVRTADLMLPRPSYWGSGAFNDANSAPTRADVRAIAYGTHVFEPGAVEVFTATSYTTASACSASYYRAWHTHARASADGLYTTLPFGDQAPTGARPLALES